MMMTLTTRTNVMRRTESVEDKQTIKSHASTYSSDDNNNTNCTFSPDAYEPNAVNIRASLMVDHISNCTTSN